MQTGCPNYSLEEQWIGNELLRAGNFLSAAAYSQRQEQLRQHGISNDLLTDGNAIALDAARDAARQRSVQLSQLEIGNAIALEAARTAYHQRIEPSYKKLVKGIVGPNPPAAETNRKTAERKNLPSRTATTPRLD